MPASLQWRPSVREGDDDPALVSTIVGGLEAMEKKGKERKTREKRGR